VKKTLLSALCLSVLLAPLNLHAGLRINEFMASNVLSRDGADGEYEDWIEIYNSGTSAVDLAGYILTDDPGGQTGLKIPSGESSTTTVAAGGFIIFLADSDMTQGVKHLNFKLPKESGRIFLIDRDGTTVIDSVAYPLQVTDVSYGRYPDGTGTWQYMTPHTGREANRQGYAGFSREPVVLTAAGFYDGGVDVSVQPDRPDDVVRYTLDCQDPEPTSAVATGPIHLDRTTVFRARAFRTGDMPSSVATRTYFVNDDRSLPVVSLVTDPDNLYDPETGIYVQPGNHTDAGHDGRAWERPAVMEFFPGRTLGFRIPGGIRTQGNSSPDDYAKQSYSVRLRQGYGEPHLDYRLFSKDTVTSFKSLVLRSGYDDGMDAGDDNNTVGTLVRDPVVTELWRRTGYPVSQGRFASLWLAGDYNGIYEIRERIDEHFFMDHLRYDDLDLMRTRWDSTELVYGSRTEWRGLVQFFQNNTFTGDAMLAEAEKRMDLDNYATLQALAHATAYYSWAYGTFMYRQKADGARWGWTIWDADRCFLTSRLNDNLLTSTEAGIMTYLRSTFTNKLLQNASYRNRYINRTADVLNTLCSPAQVKALVDSLAGIIAPELPADVARWNSSVELWNENLQSVKDFAEQRPAVVRQQFINYFGLRGQTSLHLAAERGSGSIKVNSVTIRQFPWTGVYFKDIPVTLTAIPDPGFRFDGWSDPSLPSTPEVEWTPDGDRTISAVFSPVAGINAELLAPSRVRSGQRLPVVVRVRDRDWRINPTEQTPMQVKYGGAHPDTLFKIRRGAGTGVVRVESASDFTLSAGNAAVPESHKTISMSASFPILTVSGTLPSGDVVWDGSADRLVSAKLTVPAGTRLIIRPGTWVLFGRNVGISVAGRLVVEGTENDPVVFAPQNWSEPWGGIDFQAATGSFRYCFFVNGGGDDSKGNPAVTPSSPSYGWHCGRQHILYANGRSDLALDQCFLLNSRGKALGAHFSRITMTNCVESFVWHGGELHWSRLDCRDSHFMNLPNDDGIYTGDIDTDGFHIDYVDPDHPEYSTIDHCYFVKGKDDAVDQHGARLLITNCWFEDVIHEGLAASGGDTVKVFNTVSLNNDTGFESGWTEGGVSGGPFVLVDHCVAMGNRIAGLRIGDDYSRSDSEYRGRITATNTVLSGNADNVMNRNLSSGAAIPGALAVSYSMTNDEEYDDSPHCMTGTPRFDPSYYLIPGSSGTGSGMNGTNLGRVDSTALSTGPVVINEIMYNAPPDLDTKDWVELYNPQSLPQDVSGWVLKDNNEGHAFSLPAGTAIPAGGYAVVCADLAAFRSIHPDVENCITGIGFGFGGNDMVRLYAPSGQVVDSVAYGNGGAWPGGPDGKGPSLELLSPSADNALPANWAPSLVDGGTPGKGNRLTSVATRGNGTHAVRFSLEQNYPNPFNPATSIAFSLPEPGRVRLAVFDLRGREVARLADGIRLEAGRHEARLDARTLSSGVYVYRIEAAYGNRRRDVSSKKMLLIK
jgi:hypothetical protein